MRNNCNKKFTSKSYTPNLYTWSPSCNNIKKETNSSSSSSSKPFFCNAKSGNQGFDWTTSYVYNIVVESFKQEHSAYVECDYVL